MLFNVTSQHYFSYILGETIQVNLQIQHGTDMIQATEQFILTFFMTYRKMFNKRDTMGTTNRAGIFYHSGNHPGLCDVHV